VLSPGSHHYGTPQAYTLRQGDNLAQPTPKRQEPSFASPRSVPSRYRNINRFPFRPHLVKGDLRIDLPSADDALPRNPCPFGGRDSHPALLLLPPGSAIPTGPLDLTDQLPPHRDAPLPDHGP